jgi:hypothetical protein
MRPGRYLERRRGETMAKKTIVRDDETEILCHNSATDPGPGPASDRAGAYVRDMPERTFELLPPGYPR